ncbi:MAG: DUF4091 domain-containing protein [Candidatus Aminicenantes bacterium]|nr:DUF4091 domain-containing protein [Candidatus Aminicenantes bacterium]
MGIVSLYFKKRWVFMGGLLLILGALSVCSPDPFSKACQSYEEAADPSPGLSTPWNEVESGLQASMGSVDRHYFKHSIPQVTPQHTWEGTVWRGETVSAQLVLWSREDVSNITCEFSDFIGEHGKKIPSQIAQARFVRYVLTDEFAEGCSHRNPEDYACYLYPDVLDDAECFHMHGKTTRPVWVTIQVPADTEPAQYTSFLTVSAEGEPVHCFEFSLEVLPRHLPPPSEWEFHLDLWQNPYAVARWHGLKPWSKAHWKKLRPLMNMLAQAGQKVITVSVNEKPWAAQTYDPFESMVEWRKKTDGTWAYDYRIFDQWVEFMMDLGIRDQINCYSLIPWTQELVYFDENTGQRQSVEIRPGSSEFARMWTPFLKDFSAHLKEKGWLDITNFAMDERAPEDMKNMLDYMNEVAPGFGIALADNHDSYKLFPDCIKDLSVSHSKGQIDREDLNYRKSKGFVTTFYVCCGDEFPNTFTFSDPAEAAFLGWYAAAAGFDGLLRWSYCSWVKDPLRDSRFITWPAGDTFIVYPEARSSIRFERLKEGIQDAEKIRILCREFEQSGTEKSRQNLLQLHAVLAEFDTFERPENLIALLQKGKIELEDLSRKK